ncbi:HRDC domain-containing protein [Aeromicrobium sp. IC_218]|uniref:ribonuclease D n=1 Tax=Aeromicrobium sp. IC_218 TaxID=2545468 RepID=UPI00103961EA|nr:HRDC domain-containing protein [Aeromicrobium sp. IC_218]TCI99817.1 ribonuclease D [Aeromicrobium sp. IC_218]
MSEDTPTELPAPEVPDTPPAPPLRLREPLPEVIATPEALADYVAKVAAGSGPVGLDAERASGYRYSQRAYLVQVRREGAGTALIDPIALPDLSSLDEAIGDAEWILHAATQDLVCLAEVGLRPRALFDTEHAGRLLNLPRVGLATLVESLLGSSLAKEHSAVDWSTRPLPEPWLEYAALDVEVLVELRDAMHERLVAAGKREWAAEEFEALLSFTGPAPRTDPWRRTSGIHRARGRRALGVVRDLWLARDEIARERDTTPSRVLPDAAILEIAQTLPTDAQTMRGLKSLQRRGPRRFLARWLQVVDDVLQLDDADLPSPSPRADGPPPPRTWTEKNPAAAERLGAVREVMTALATEHDLPSENLLTPHLVRELAWSPPSPIDAPTVAETLLAHGARRWQVSIVAEPLADALRSPATA